MMVGMVTTAQNVRQKLCLRIVSNLKTRLPAQSCGASTMTAVKKVHVGNITAMSLQHWSF